MALNFYISLYPFKFQVPPASDWYIFSTNTKTVSKSFQFSISPNLKTITLRNKKTQLNWQSFLFVFLCLSHLREKANKQKCFKRPKSADYRKKRQLTIQYKVLKSSDFHFDAFHLFICGYPLGKERVPKVEELTMGWEKRRKKKTSWWRRKVFAECNWISSTLRDRISNYLPTSSSHSSFVSLLWVPEK